MREIKHILACEKSRNGQVIGYCEIRKLKKKEEGRI